LIRGWSAEDTLSRSYQGSEYNHLPSIQYPPVVVASACKADGGGGGGWMDEWTTALKDSKWYQPRADGIAMFIYRAVRILRGVS
jgi:hypothetical protein